MSTQSNIMGTMPVGRLVLHMSWPIMLSMLTQAIYNLVDSIYVAQLGDSAFLALSYAYPVQTLLVAFCVGIGVGFNAILSRRLGEKKAEDANAVILHGFLLYGLCWLVFLVFGLFFCPLYLDLCTDTPAVALQGVQYLQVCCCLAAGVCIQFPCERILQATGHPAGFMIVQGTGAILNLILDPILIFGFGMGVRGAAIATVTGQITGGLVGFFLLWRIREQLPISVRAFRFQPALVAEMGRISAPAILIQSLGSIMSLGMNGILNLWSETAVWVLGVYFKLQNFVFMPVFSVNNGLVSIISYNYGARDRDRVTASIRFGLVTALTAACIGSILLWLCAAPLLTVCFQASTQALDLGVSALRMAALGFPPAAVSIVFSSAFQSLGRSRNSLLIALLRQVMLLLPIALLLVYIWPELTFLALPTAEGIVCLLSLSLYRQLNRTIIQTI